MRSPTRVRRRRVALWGGSAVAVVVGAAGLSAGCAGGGHGRDYVAVGAADDPARPGAVGPARPTDGVRLFPLDGESGSPGGDPGPGSTARNPAGAKATTDPSGAFSSSGAGPSPAPVAASGDGQDAPQDQRADGGAAGRTPPDSPSPAPSPPSSPKPSAPSGGASGEPAALAVSEPVRAATDRRWCEDVTLTFTNSGGTPAGSGTVAFGTHIVDALGIDWATRGSTAPLPAPIAAGARTQRTWTVCVDAWRVPLGMHIETRDVSVRWR